MGQQPVSKGSFANIYNTQQNFTELFEKWLAAEFGSAADYTKFLTDGTLRAYGEATTWDDISGSLIAARLSTASGRLDYDYFNGGVNFNSNARYPEEPVVIPQQQKHAQVIGEGAVIRPHMHWLQAQAAVPNFLLGYKFTNYGDATTLETDWTNYTFMLPDSSVFTYVSGVLAQIINFPEIDSSSLTISASVDFVLFRDSANASGLFAGVDPVAGDVVVKYNDAHVKTDSFGSAQEFIKDPV